MKRLTMLTSLIVALSLVISCTDKGETDIPVNDWPWGEKPEPEQPQPDTPDQPVIKEEPNQAIVDAGWVNLGDTYGELPEHISVYRSPETLQDKAAIAYIAVVDLTKAFQNIANSTYEYIIPYIVLAVVYFALVFVVTQIVKAIERRLRASDKR